MKPPSGWSSLFVLALMLLSVAWSIQALDWTAGLEILTPIVLGAVIVGAVLGRQLWLPASLAHGWSTIIGLASVAFFGTFVLAEYHPQPDHLAALSRLEQMAEVRDWFIAWLAIAVNDGAVESHTARFVFVLWMAMLLWLVGYIATWFVARYVNWWGAVLPSGFALLANLYNAPQSYLSYLAFFLMCAFLLAVQTHLALQLDHWRREQITFSPDIGIGFLRDGLLVAVAAIGFAWLTPGEVPASRLQSAVSRLVDGSRPFSDSFNRLFPSLDYPVRGGGSSFGPEMPLGGSITLGTNPVFDATISGVPEGITPRYWRMAVFDTYSGSSWQRTVDSRLTSGASGLGLTSPMYRTAPVTQTIKTYQRNTRQLFAAPQPYAFSIPVEAEVAGDNPAPDVLTVDSKDNLSVGQTYEVVSYMSSADVMSLRAAGTEDPDWVRVRYLGLPAAVPDAVRSLSLSLTGPYENRYDQLDAIEDYLRQIPYSDSISTPPSNHDLVEWFLFEEQQGYCDYYASAFVVLARAAGIPARLAAGYAAGDYLPSTGIYRQREYDAHTWPEAYFPRYGWIEFEPTAADDEVQRPPAASASDAEEPANAPEPPARDEMLPDDGTLAPREPLTANGDAATGPDSRLDLKRLWPLFFALITAGVAGVIVVIAWERQFKGLTPAEGAFAKLIRIATWIGLAPQRGDTPFEYRDRVSAAIPDGRTEIAAITAAYVRERFGRHPSEKEAAPLLTAWRRLRQLLIRAGTQTGLARIRHRLTDGHAGSGRGDRWGA